MYAPDDENLIPGAYSYTQKEPNLLLSMPPADARAAQGKSVSRADAQPGASPAEPDLNMKSILRCAGVLWRSRRKACAGTDVSLF